MVRKCFSFLLLLILIGCASSRTSLKQYSGLEEKLAVRDFQGAIAKIKKSKDKYYSKKDKVLYYLDLGMLYHFNKDYEKSNETLAKAEKHIDENYTKSISKAAVSLLLNDNALEYSGEDYEDIYLNIFKAINYLELDLFDDAFVEIRRVNNKLNLLEDKYKKLAKELGKAENNKAIFEPAENKFHNDALSRYLSMLIYRAEGKYDDARIDQKKITEAWQQQSHIYDHPLPDFEGYLINPEDTRVNFTCFIGKSPVKGAKTFYIHTEKDIIIIAATERKPDDEKSLDFLNAIPWDGVKAGYHFKLQLPYMEQSESCINKIKIIIDGSPAGELSLLEDIGIIALETYKIKEPIIYFKTIARTIIKGIFAEKRKEEIGKEIKNPILKFAARIATDAAVDATENADLRISRFFPDQALIGEFKIPAGQHDINIQYYSRNGSLLFVDKFPGYEIKEGSLNLINSFYLN